MTRTNGAQLENLFFLTMGFSVNPLIQSDNVNPPALYWGQALGNNVFGDKNNSTGTYFRGGSFNFNNSALEVTGSGTTAVGGANNPAVTPGSIFKWIKCALSDGSVVYIPCWK